MKRIILISIWLLTYSSKSQVVSTELRPLSPNELSLSEIISGTIAPISNGKVMACAGNAANDNWANAIGLTVNGGLIGGTTCGTMEAGETKACYSGATQTVWYKFVATATTHYVQIISTGGSCFFASAVYWAGFLPGSNCGDTGPISCQSASGGPGTHLYQLTNLTIGNTYYIQVLYNGSGPCGSNATFNIGVTTANPGGTITNPPPLTTCSTPGAGCFFSSPPTVNTVTSTCTSYPLAAAGYNANTVWSTVIQFTSSASWSNFSWQAIITSNCGAGNVVWLNWTLYDCSCNQITCGDIGTLTGNGLACGTCYRLRYQMELANCSSFTTIWPYQNVPSSPLPCSVLPLELLYFTADPEPNGKKVNVEWESLTETDLREYSVERSEDGINFHQLTTIASKGTKNHEPQKYNYEDACCNNQETRYYKLRAIDNDGSVSYQKTIAVTFKNNKEIIKFAPNPANSNFIISFGEDALNLNSKIQVYNAVGKLVLEEDFVPTTFFKQFNIEEFPVGIYFINLVTPASTESIKYKLIKE